jgi:hypothetical protein
VWEGYFSSFDGDDNMHVRVHLTGLPEKYIKGLVRRGWAADNADAIRMTIVLHMDKHNEIGWREMNSLAIERAGKYRSRREKIDHDMIAYGVSRDGTTLEEFERKQK